MNFIQVTPVCPQHRSFLEIFGLDHVPLGFPVKFTVNVGVAGPH